jgi:hypothetical protein
LSCVFVLICFGAGGIAIAAIREETLKNKAIRAKQAENLLVPSPAITNPAPNPTEWWKDTLCLKCYCAVKIKADNLYITEFTWNTWGWRCPSCKNQETITDPPNYVKDYLSKRKLNV